MKWDVEAYCCAEMDEAAQNSIEAAFQGKPQLLLKLEQQRDFFLLLRRQGLRKKIKDALSS